MEDALARVEASPRPLLDRIGGLVDLFAWPLSTSHYLELVNPLWATHKLQARIESLREETPAARTLTLRPGRGWQAHRPGQHLQVGVTVGGAHHTRTYSIASAPERWATDGCIEITVKAVDGGRVSQHLVRHARPGSLLRLGLPQGDFTLPDADPLPKLLFVTAGSGITPVMSMLRSLCAHGELPDIVHVHHAPRAADTIFARELEQLATEEPRYRLHLVHTRGPDAPLAARHFSGRQLDDVCPDWGSRETYACGPQVLLDAMETHWRTARPASRLHVERFRAALAETPAVVGGGRVRFVRSGFAIESDGHTSLLQVAESAGMNPPHGCRMGICHSCTATLRAGCVRDLRSNALIHEPGARVQVCVTAASGDVDLEL